METPTIKITSVPLEELIRKEQDSVRGMNIKRTYQIEPIK